MRRLLVVLAIVAASGPSLAQNIPSECHGTGYTVYDDRSFEKAAGGNTFADRAQYVMLFDVGPGLITEICVRFGYFPDFSFDPNSADVFFNINVYDSLGGQPGNLIDQLTGLFILDLGRNASRWLKVEVPGGGIEIQGDAFIGVEWDPRDLSGDLVYVSFDDSLGTPRQPAFFSNDPASSGSSWLELGQIGALPSYRALAIRARIEEPPPPPLPTADFSFTISDLRVDFQNESLNATSYHWDFGDLTETTLSNPFHVYEADGTYDVTLTATNQTGSDSRTRSVTVAAPEPPGGLDFGPTAIVLNGRFRVEVFYETATGSGRALGAVYEDASSFWHFFGEANIEVFAKVLNACGLNGNFWVFAAGATTVGVEIRVTDTQTGAVRIYTNPLGRTFVTITDTSAFACAP